MSAKAVSGAQAVSIRDALYEAPGPKTRAKIRVGTAVSAVLVALLLGFAVYQFWATGQLDPRYWMFFTQASTWSYLFAGLRGTLAVALTAGAIALVLGLLLMLGRTSGVRPLAALCRVVTDFFRGVPSLLLIYFFFLVVPQYGGGSAVRHQDVLILDDHAAGGARRLGRARRGVPRRRQRRAARSDRGGPRLGDAPLPGQAQDRAAPGDPLRDPLAHLPIGRGGQGHHGRIRGELPGHAAERARAHHQLRCAGEHVSGGGPRRRTRSPRSTPAARSSAGPSPAPWPCAPPRCWATSLPPRSTPR